MADQEDQEQNRHIAIEMHEFDDLPFAEMAALPLREREAREHRIAPIISRRLLDGPQVRQLTVRAARPHRHHRRARIEGNEPGDIIMEQPVPPTEEQRNWYRRRETPGIEDARSPRSTHMKILITAGVVLLLIFVVAFAVIVYLLATSEPKKVPESFRKNRHGMLRPRLF